MTRTPSLAALSLAAIFAAAAHAQDPVPPAEGLEDCTKLPLITKELVARGYSDDDIRKILGGNFMRVFKQVCIGE